MEQRISFTNLWADESGRARDVNVSPMIDFKVGNYCHNCKGDNHNTARCTSNPPKPCDICASTSHKAKDCPDKPVSEGKKCFDCQQGDHFASECPNPKRIAADKVCYKCKELGHDKKNCPKQGKLCRKCNKWHKGACAEPCDNCGDTDHSTHACPETAASDTQQPRQIMGAKLDKSATKSPASQDSFSGPIPPLAYDALPVKYFSINHSYVAAVADGLTVLGYKGVSTGPSVNQHQKALQARVLFPKIFQYQGNNPHMLLVMDKSATQGRDPATQSVFNQGNVEHCFNIARLLHRNGFSLKEVAIQTPYAADLTLLKSTQQAVVQHFQLSTNKYCMELAQDLGDLMIVTSDSMRDFAHPFVILSIPNTDSIGFLEETARMIMSVSRAQFGIIIVCNYEKLCEQNHDNSHFFKSALFELLTWLVQGKNYVKPKDLPKHQQKDWKLPVTISENVERGKFGQGIVNTK